MNFFQIFGIVLGVLGIGIWIYIGILGCKIMVLQDMIGAKLSQLTENLPSGVKHGK